MKKTANRPSVQAVVRRFHWRCQDCRLDGHLDIALPLSLRHVAGLLEDAHETARGKHTCPSNYFEITDVTTQNVSGQPRLTGKETT